MPAHNPVIHTLPSKGSHEITTHGGDAVRYRPNGKVSDLHDTRRGMDIHRGLNGSQRIVVEHPDHSRIVVERGHPGFVGRQFGYRGEHFERRTYVYEGRSYEHYYHEYRYRGVDMHVYAPDRYYHREYYGWAYNPWQRPVYYHWGWERRPWYDRFGFFFSPYPSYPSASYWLTDYMLAADMQAAYAAQQQAGVTMGDPSAGAAPLSPEVKQQISDEVRSQLAVESQEAQQNAQQQSADPGASGIGRMFDDAAQGHSHVLVVGTPLDVVDGSGMECALSDGDVLLLRSAPPPDSPTATLYVLASKGGTECPKSDAVSVRLEDIQEMQNQMRAMIDQGLGEMQKGQGGLPPAPAAAVQATPAVYTTVTLPPEANASAELQQQAQQAQQAETDVTSTVGQEAGGQAATPTVVAGQTIAEVEAILGQPRDKALLGSKVVYNYNGMKVIFINGRVTDVQ
ncbi:MAG: hypothetical protein WCE75_11280 [Terracidiphilus sp.]